MKSRIVALVCAAVLACSVACLAACSSSNQKSSGDISGKVVIGTLATEDILPMWVAEEEGMFTDAGMNVTIEVFQSATELIAGIVADEVDMAMTDPMVTAAIVANSGVDLQIKWITLGTTAEQGRFGIMTSADSGITSLQDLAGKGIGVGSNTILEYVMDVLMEREGIAPSDIVVEEMQKLPVRYQEMQSGAVAAAALPASLLALGEASGCVLIADDTTGENISQSVMVAHTDFLKKDNNAAIVEKIKSIWNDAVAKINANPEAYRALLVQKANLSDAVAATYPICEYPTSQLPTNKMIDPILTWMQEKGYLDKQVTYNASDGTFKVS